MKKLLTLSFLFLTIIQKINGQTYLPVPTTGYTLDAVAENTTALSTTSGALDGGGNCFYSQAYGSLVSSTYGLPNNGILSSLTRTYQLQSYTTANCLFIPTNGQSDTLTLVTPAAFTSLSLLGFATETNGSMSVTVRFTDNSTEVFSGISVLDWFNASTPFASGFDRLARATGVLENVGAAGNPRFFAHDLALSCANQSKLVKRIIIKNSTSGSKICIWALSGVSLPLTASTSPGNLCTTGGSSTLTAAGATSYTWLPVGSFAGSTSTQVSVQPSVTTQYTVQAVSSSTCVYNALVTVNVFSVVPTLTVTNTANLGGICPNSSVILTANGATTYTWTGGSIPVTNGVAFSPTSTVDYTVTGGNACGTSTAVSSISVHIPPTIGITALTGSICSGNTTTVSVTGNASTFTISSQIAGPSVTNNTGFTPAVTNTYIATGTGVNSCTAAASVSIQVVQTPTLAPTSNTLLLCIGKSATLSATGATGYTWTSGSSTIATTNTTVVTPNTTTTYSITKNNSTCFDTKAITITVQSLTPVFVSATQTLICASQTTTLSGFGGVAYQWFAPGQSTFFSTSSSPVVSPSVNTTYTMTASDGTCINTAVVTIATNTNPIISVVASATQVCVGASITLTASGSPNFTWTSAPATTSITGQNTLTATFTASGAIAFNAIGDNAQGCTASAGQVIIINPGPNMNASASKTLICSAGSTTLSASGADLYQWDNNANNAITPSVVVSPTQSTTYLVTGTLNSTGCTASKTVQVGIYIPTLTVSQPTNVCQGGQVALSGQVNNPASGSSNSYTWTGAGLSGNAGSAVVVSPSAPTIYTLSAKSITLGSLTCIKTETTSVGIFANPNITVTPSRTFVCRGEPVNLVASGGVSYTWNNNSMSGPTVTVTHSTISTFSYVVVGTDTNGCKNDTIFYLKVNGCQGIEEYQNTTTINIYPNPNNGEFNIKSEKDLTIQLFNDLGQVIRTYQLNAENNYLIQVSDLAKGIYFIADDKNRPLNKQKIIIQ
ncbi:MAG: T9SS type A sorting domain-containing protein [Bacteroidia bacterium]|nr:T9SS type A sorting domain-containing protein [Bacteroidia bacterium]